MKTSKIRGFAQCLCLILFFSNFIKTGVCGNLEIDGQAKVEDKIAVGNNFTPTEEIHVYNGNGEGAAIVRVESTDNSAQLKLYSPSNKGATIVSYNGTTAKWEFGRIPGTDDYGFYNVALVGYSIRFRYSDNNVGIKTNTPNASLDVNGSARIVKDLAFNEVSGGNIPNTDGTPKAWMYAEERTDGVEGPTPARTEMRVLDEAGNRTTISPHNFSLFTPAPDDPLPWSYRSENGFIGKAINVDMSGAIRALERLTGLQFIHVEDLPAEKRIDYESWRETAIQNRIQEEKENFLDRNPRVEISLADAWEEADELQWITQDQTRVEYRINWETMAVEPVEITEPERALVPTGRRIKQLKRGVTFDSATGKLYKELTDDEVELDAQTLETIQNYELPQYVLDRLPLQ